MASWSRRRKSIYALIVIVVAAGAIGFPALYIFYRAPTCFDGKMNGTETGIDCGGGCVKLCPSAFLQPVVAWTRYEEVAPHVYNLSAYIINPNPNAEATLVPYHMVLYGPGAVRISDVSGKITIPAHRNTLAFIASVSTGMSAPVRSPVFDFTVAPDWHITSDPLRELVIADKRYSEDLNGSALLVTLENSGVKPIGRLSVGAVLYDEDKNVVGFSKTVIDSIDPKGTAVAPFTWPVNRKGTVISEEILPVRE